MKIAIVAPSPIPFVIGGAEKLWWGLLQAVNSLSKHQAELIKLPCPESGFQELIQSYRRFSRLDLTHFDLVVSTKYPAWMVSHPKHLIYMQHRLRGLYDTYPGPAGGRLPEHPGLCGLLSILEQTPNRKVLPRLFAELEELLGKPETARLFPFPGPLTRRVIHFLDDVALEPGQISRYCAISANVARRKDYFPSGVQPAVIHHPSDLSGFANTGYEHIFTASRLDGLKRLDLLIKAFRKTDANIELIIGGTGPEEKGLKSLAAGDPRIRFLGFVNEEVILEHYARSLFVPYIPCDEDYGLITIEAMHCQKAVLTVQDAGGVNEFVEHEVNGLCVPPDEKHLARAIEHLIANPEETKAMGARGEHKVKDITWAGTVKALFETGDPARKTLSKPASRKKIVVATTFPVYPPQGGGPCRIFHLYREVAKQVEVDLVTLIDHGEPGGKAEVAPGLFEIRVPKSRAHQDAECEMQGLARAPVADIAAIRHYDKTPELVERLAKASKGARAAVASHPYLFFALVRSSNCELWHESHNCELDLKTQILAGCPRPDPFLDLVRQAEEASVLESRQVYACSQEDAERLSRLYGRQRQDFLIVPNGVDAPGVRFTDPGKRQSHKARLGLEGLVTAMFMGSLHGPNIDAVSHICRLAPGFDNVLFLIIGSVCNTLYGLDLPGNVKPLGIVREREKSVLLAASDVALNPISSGSGTNLKLLEYAAAGVPILSTPFGTRGTDLTGEHLVLAEGDDFPQVLRDMLRDGATDDLERLQKARELVKSKYDWRVIAGKLKELVSV